MRNASHRATNRSARVFWKGLRGCEPRYFFQRRFFGFWFEMMILRSGSRFQIRVSRARPRGDFFYPGPIQISPACQRVCFGVFATILNPRSIPSSKFRFRVSKCQISDLELELADLDSRCWEMVQTNAPTTNPFVFDRNTLFLTSLTCSPNTLIWCRNNSIRLLL